MKLCVRRSTELGCGLAGPDAAGLCVRETAIPGGLQLEMWPSRMLALPVAIFTFLWLRFLWRWYALILLASLHEARGFLLVFGLPFFAAGVSLIATSARLVLGRTIVQLDALRLSVGDAIVADLNRPTLVAPASSIVEFVAECSTEGDDEQELDAWQVHAKLGDGSSLPLPLPVRSLREAEQIARRLTRALHVARTPTGYRDTVA